LVVEHQAKAFRGVVRNQQDSSALKEIFVQMWIGE